MTMKLAGGIAAGAFALGILNGGAGTILARDVAAETEHTAVMAEHMDGQGMASMMSMMGGSMMGGSSMGGPNASMGPDMMGPGASAMPSGQHGQHHASAAPGASE